MLHSKAKPLDDASGFGWGEKEQTKDKEQM